MISDPNNLASCPSPTPPAGDRWWQAQILEQVHLATLAAQSPWLDRKAAAAWAHCSVSEIDRAANAGVFRRYMRNGTPMFKKADLDKALEEGTWRKAES